MLRSSASENCAAWILRPRRRISDTESQSETPALEFQFRLLKPSSLIIISRPILRVTGESATAQGVPVDALDDPLELLQIASKIESIWEHPMTPSNGLNPLNMGVSRHDISNLLLSTGCNDVEEADQVLFNLSKLIAEPHPHMTNNLLSAAAAGVKLASMFFPMISPSLRSLAVEISSTLGTMVNVPASHSFWISWRPCSIFSCSCVMMPDFASAGQKRCFSRHLAYRGVSQSRNICCT